MSEYKVHHLVSPEVVTETQNDILDPKKQKRGFTGLWIPASIWFDENLSLSEKCVIAEVSSLAASEKGCFASNAYWGKFLGMSESGARKIIDRLRSYGYIENYGFNGRFRKLRLPQTGHADSPKSDNLHAPNGAPYILVDSKVENKVNTAAKAAMETKLCEEVKSFESTISEQCLLKLSGKSFLAHRMALNAILIRYESNIRGDALDLLGRWLRYAAQEARLPIELSKIPGWARGQAESALGIVKAYGLAKAGEVINFAINDPFWSVNFNSLSSFREVEIRMRAA